MQWKYWAPWPYWSGSRSFLLLRDGVPIAHAGIVPLRFSLAGKTHTLVQLIDWAAEPRSVGTGVSLLKRIVALADGAVSVRGSSMTQRILKPIGFRSLPGSVRYAAPICAAARPLRSHLSLRIHARGRFAPLEHPLHDAESFADRIVFQRSAAQMLAWSTCPVAPMHYGEVFSGDRLAGTFLICFTPQQARIADVWACDGAWDDVLELAHRHASESRDVVEVVCQTNDPAQARALLACGFTAAGTDPLAILASPGLVADGAFIPHHMIDSDLAYLHHGEFVPWLS